MPMKTNFIRSLCAIIVLAFASGCATSMQVARIVPELSIHPDPARLAAPPGAVSVEPFKLTSPEQTDPKVIGEAKLGLLNTKARILSTDDIGALVTAAVEHGFRQAGFIVTNASNADYVVGGSVDRFWVDEYATGLSLEYSRATVRFDLMVKDRTGNSVWASTLDKFMTSERSEDATEYDIPTLAGALGAAVEAIFQDPTFWKAFPEKVAGAER